MPISSLPLPLADTDLRQVVDDLARTPLSKVVWFVVALSVIRVLIYPYLRNTPVHKRSGAFGGAKFLNEILDAFIYAGVFVFMLIRPFGVQAFLIPSGSMWPTLYVNDFIVANKAIYRYTDPKPNDVVVFRPPVEATQGHPDQVDSEGNVKVDFIKRCIGTPGDIIELRNGVLYRNGKPDLIDDGHRHYSACTIEPPPDNCPDFRSLSDAEVGSMTKQNFKLVNYKGQIIPFNWTGSDGNAKFPSRSYGDPPYSAPYSVADKYVFDDQSEAMKVSKNAPPQPVPKGYYLMMGDNRNGSFDGRAWGLVPRDAIIGRAEFIWFPLSRMGRVR